MIIVFCQAMSDHFDHYKRPPSRDNSVDRYSRAASRLSGGSRQSSVEKSQSQQQPRRGGDDRIPSSSSSATDKSFSGATGFTAASAAGAKQNISSSAATQCQTPPFEDIILKKRNLGQEIVPSPIGQPKRTESLYVNPNTARKETKPKVSTKSIQRRSSSNSVDSSNGQRSHGGSVGGGVNNHNSYNSSFFDSCCFNYYWRKIMREDDASVDSHGYDSRSIDDGRFIKDDSHSGAIVKIDDSGEIEGSVDGRNDKISNTLDISDRDVGCSMSNSEDNYGSSVNGDDHVSMLSVNTNRGVVRPSRDNHRSSRGRGEERSCSVISDDCANSSMIPLSNSNDHSSGNAACANSSVIRHSRSKSEGLRVRFSDEVSFSDDPLGRRGGSNRGRNHIRNNRHSSCDSYLDSRDPNQVTSSVNVGGQNREISHNQITRNMLNFQISAHGNASNIGNYSIGNPRSNLYNIADDDIMHTAIYGGYDRGGIACRNDNRDESVVHGRYSIRGRGGGYITNNIRGIRGIYFRNSEARGRGDGRHGRGVVIREIANGIADNGDDSENENIENAVVPRFNGFNNRTDDDGDEGYYGSEGGSSVGGRRIRRLLPQIPLVQHIFWFKTYLYIDYNNLIFYN